jgi:hypothetical protein
LSLCKRDFQPSFHQRKKTREKFIFSMKLGHKLPKDVESRIDCSSHHRRVPNIKTLAAQNQRRGEKYSPGSERRLLA